MHAVRLISFECNLKWTCLKCPALWASEGGIFLAERRSLTPNPTPNHGKVKLRLTDFRGSSNICVFSFPITALLPNTNKEEEHLTSSWSYGDLVATKTSASFYYIITCRIIYVGISMFTWLKRCRAFLIVERKLLPLCHKCAEFVCFVWCFSLLLLLVLALCLCIAFSSLISHEPEKQTRSDSLLQTLQLSQQGLPGDMDACNIIKYLFYAVLSVSLNFQGIYRIVFLITVLTVVNSYSEKDLKRVIKETEEWKGSITTSYWWKRGVSGESKMLNLDPWEKHCTLYAQLVFILLMFIGYYYYFKLFIM